MSPSIYEPIPLSSIKADPEIQSRQQLNKGIVKEYKEAMLGKDKFPPIIVFDDGADYWLADGFHRYYAAQDAEMRGIRHGQRYQINVMISQQLCKMSQAPGGILNENGYLLHVHA